MEDAIFGVRTAVDGVWYYGAEVRGGKVTNLDTNIVFAQRMAKSQAQKVAAEAERETGAFWYVVPVAIRRG